MNKIHVTQLYSVSKVTIGSELFYLCELGKYLYYRFDSQLSLDGVLLTNELRSSRYWEYMRLAYHNGWICDLGIDNFDLDITPINPLAVNPNLVRNIYLTNEVLNSPDERIGVVETDHPEYYPIKYNVAFKEQTPERWVWDIDSNDKLGYYINQKLRGNLSSQSWVSLFAFVKTNMLMYGEPSTGMEFYIDGSLIHNIPLPIVDVFLLATKTDALNFVDILWVDSSVDEKDKNFVEYATWWFEAQEHGFMQNVAEGNSVEAKRKYFEQLGLGIGDVIGVYTRPQRQRTNYIKDISSFNYGVITGITKNGISVDLVQNMETILDSEITFANYSEEVRALYSFSDSYRQLRHKVVHYDFIDIGIHWLLASELTFITPLIGDDAIPLKITRERKNDAGGYNNIFALDYETVILPETEAIYWLLKDYNIDFDTEKYLKRYGRNEAMAYDRYMDGDSISEFRRVEEVE